MRVGVVVFGCLDSQNPAIITIRGSTIARMVVVVVACLAEMVETVYLFRLVSETTDKDFQDMIN